jgi:hypothetical protein
MSHFGVVPRSRLFQPEEVFMIDAFRFVAGAVCATFMLVPSAFAGTVTGALTYDGLPVLTTLPEITSGSVSAFNTDSRERTLGTVDVVAGTYAIDLPAGTYNISWVLGVDDVSGATSAEAGDLVGNLTNIEVPEGDLSLDATLYYVVHVTAPFDNADGGVSWGGSADVCPYGPLTTSPVVLQWDPVPGAVHYTVWVGRIACPDFVENVPIEVGSGTSAVIDIDPDEAETISVSIVGHSVSGNDLSTMPNLSYGNIGTVAHYLHALETVGRPTGNADASTILQIANLPGSGDTFWTSDVVLSNPTGSDIPATLTFTPRGADGRMDYTDTVMLVPAGTTRTVANAVEAVTGTTGAGSLEIRPAAIQAWARTSTAGGDGRYGQGFPAVTVTDDAVDATGGVLTAGGVVRGPSRTNLILAELWGESAEATVTLFDADGVTLGEKTYAIAPLGNTQVNDLVRRIAGDVELADARVEVAVSLGDGRVAGALSIVDQSSDDPITVMLER